MTVTVKNLGAIYPATQILITNWMEWRLDFQRNRNHPFIDGYSVLGVKAAHVQAWNIFARVEHSPSPLGHHVRPHYQLEKIEKTTKESTLKP